MQSEGGEIYLGIGSGGANYRGIGLSPVLLKDYAELGISLSFEFYTAWQHFSKDID